jgi:iron complex outermembrane receptor protein
MSGTGMAPVLTLVLLWAGYTDVWALDQPFGDPTRDIKIASTAAEDVGHAQQGVVLTEIVVTARRREESVQDVPISVTAFSPEQIAERRLTNLQDLNAAAPALTLTGGDGSSREQLFFAIRGQGQCTACLNPGVITYFADVPGANTDSFFDLANIQVLEGPQGTLFGRNTTGGAVLLVPAAPTRDLSGYATVRLGNYDDREYEGAVGGGLTDWLRVRAAGQIRLRDGFTRDITSGVNLDNVERKNARLSVQLLPVAGLDSTTILYYEDLHESTGQVISAIEPRPANFALYPALAAAVAAQPALGPRAVGVDPGFYPADVIRNKGGINTTRWDVNDHIFVKNIVGYVWRQVIRQADLDGSAVPLIAYQELPSYPEPLATQTSDELQVGGQAFDNKLSWLAGGYHETRNSSPSNVVARAYLPAFCDVLSPTTPATADGLPGCFYYIPLASNSQHTRSNAGFLHGEYSFTDALTLSAGYRHTVDRIVGQTYGITSATGSDYVATGTAQRANFSGNSWDVSLQYKPTSDVMTYAAIRRGYRGGGLNLGAPAAIAEIQKYDPETVTDYEIGTKIRWEAGGMQGTLNVDVFHDDYQNIQRAVIFPLAAGVDTVVVRNAAKGRINGLDLSALVRPVRWFDLSLSYTYLDARYTNWPDLDPTTLAPISRTNEVFANTPKNKFTVSPRLNFPLGADAGDVSFLAQVTYQTRIGVNDVNTQYSFVSGYTLVNLHADWHDVLGSKLAVGLFATNVTNKTYPISISDATQGNADAHVSYTYGEPRMYGIEARYDF